VPELSVLPAAPLLPAPLAPEPAAPAEPAAPLLPLPPEPACAAARAGARPIITTRNAKMTFFIETSLGFELGVAEQQKRDPEERRNE